MLCSAGNVLGQQFPTDDAAFHLGLEHGKYVAVHLRLVGHERSGSVQNAGVDLPPGAGLQTIGAGVKEDSVVALVPFFQAAADIFFGRARLQAHVGVGKIVLYLVVLRREVIGFRLSLLPHQLGEGIALVHVVGDGAHVVKKLAQQVPSAFALHHVGAEQQISGSLDRFFQQEFAAALGPDVTEPLVGQSVWPIRRFGGRRKPALVDAAAVAAKGVKIVRMEL